ncbi:MAG: hypothetical protein H6R14_40 [Proteobacteria bacterium]|nr:hypothetical protein [Pseudomonadota bacterium]
MAPRCLNSKVAHNAGEIIPVQGDFGMNDLRRKLILLGGIAAIPMSSGCLTAAMMSGNDRDNYRETVGSVLLSADGKTLAVIGKDYHYLFDAPDAIKAVLQPDLRDIVNVHFQTFSVDAAQRITGGYTMNIAKTASAEQKDKAIAAGFKPLPNGTLNFSGSLTGTRYSANGIQAENTAQKLRKDYSINVSAEKSAGAKAASTAGKLLVTPITLAADGVLFLVAVPLLLIVAMGSAVSH